MIKCKFEDDHPVFLRHAVVHALVIKDGQVLLVKRAPNISNPNLYAIPGGFVDRDETTAQAALRELREETGYSGKILKLFSICDYPDRRGEDRQNIAFTYLIEAGELVGEPDQESTTVEWFDLQHLPSAAQMAFDHQAHLDLYLSQNSNQSPAAGPIMMSGG